MRSVIEGPARGRQGGPYQPQDWRRRPFGSVNLADRLRGKDTNKMTILKSHLSLGCGDRLTAEKPLPERALNFGGEFRPFVGQKFDGAGLILNQF